MTQPKQNWNAGGLNIVPANIVSAFDERTIGSKVVDPDRFIEFLAFAIGQHDFTKDKVPGQGKLYLPPEAYATVSAGEGRHSQNPDDYVLRFYRGRVGTYLKRQKAAPVESLAVVVYTRAAYLGDPQVQAPSNVAEVQAIEESAATHVLVCVLAGSAAPDVLTPVRFIANLAGGNREALLWTADEIRAKAMAVQAHGSEWGVVAD